MDEYEIVLRHHYPRRGGRVVVVVQGVEAADPAQAHQMAVEYLKEIYEASSVKTEIRRETKVRIFADTLAEADGIE